MSLPIRPVTPSFAVAAQLAPGDLATVAAMGFKTVINNRPDLEGGPDQPASTAMQAAAEAAGLAYVYLPVVAGSYSPSKYKPCAARWTPPPSRCWRFAAPGRDQPSSLCWRSSWLECQI